MTVEYSASDHATRYTASDGNCSITWIAYTGGPNEGLIKHSPRCDAPLAAQYSLLAKISAALFGSGKEARTFRTLFWGGLEAEQKPSYELPLRLALAAYRSAEWDSRKGTPKHGDLNRFIKNLANEAQIYPELRELFFRHDRGIELATVEKVRVLEAGKLPFFARLKQDGVLATDKLPFDCMAWFSLTSLAP